MRILSPFILTKEPFLNPQTVQMCVSLMDEHVYDCPIIDSLNSTFQVTEMYLKITFCL